MVSQYSAGQNANVAQAGGKNTISLGLTPPPKTHRSGTTPYAFGTPGMTNPVFPGPPVSS